MGFQKTGEFANSNTPQIVTLIVDDSESMTWDHDKCGQATAAVQDLIIQLQSQNLGAGSFRYLLNICKFGDIVQPIAESAAPAEVDVNRVVFRGELGTTEMAAALNWASTAIAKSLVRLRANPNYNEQNAPRPLVFFFSDGVNTDDSQAVVEAAAKVKVIPFRGVPGLIDVLSIGIGMDPKDFPIMQSIASAPEHAMNIDPSQLAEFIATAQQTMVSSTQCRQEMVKILEVKYVKFK